MPEDVKPPDMPPPGTGGKKGGRRYMLYDGMIHVDGTQAWRNNNPGNIEAGEEAKQLGAIGSDGRFAVFPNYAAGRTALEAALRADAAQNLSVGEVVRKHAPNSVGTACNQLGVAPTALVAALTALQFSSLVGIIQELEGWDEGEVITPANRPLSWGQRLLYWFSGESYGPTYGSEIMDFLHDDDDSTDDSSVDDSDDDASDDANDADDQATDNS